MEGAGLEALQSSSSIEFCILNSESGLKKKKFAGDLNVPMWKDVHDILLSVKKQLVEQFVCLE